jgi:hypothetical protein
VQGGIRSSYDEMFFWKNFSRECLEVSTECVGWLILDTSWRFFEEDFRE